MANQHGQDNRNKLVKDIKIPKMATVRQIFDKAQIEDLDAELAKELHQDKILTSIKPGMSIAITAGSRGIDRIDKVTKAVVDFLIAQGAKPFIVPAMGSHGGAVAEGQIEVLESFGITEKTMGCPIKATMEVDIIATMEDGTNVYIDKYAHEADGIVVINRIKLHTGFRGKHESGLFKMMCVGLGKQKGAETVHNRGRKKMSESVEFGGKAYLEHANVLFGVALVENAFDHLYKISALTPNEMIEEEPKLLELSRTLLPQIWFENLDVLIVDRIGKNISGAGMDPNITKSFTEEAEIGKEGRAAKIVVLDLTEETHGAAVGLGVADITTIRLFEKANLDNTYTNLLTTGATDLARIPMMLGSHELAIQAAIKTAINADKSNLRIVRIQDTLHLSEIQVSEALAKEAAGDARFEVLKEAEYFSFDESGNLFD